ncbi:hypothetical protein C1H76_0008 [Elsinoe australis]|uniref:DJ-1/PfpI domain-containing protein n=1 Tax=Elsinoe australis TaxID=40998 RepID=A0A4U7BFV5_9PEZI|nr:hypothetical protein C1H76_0008 [Elsinoe australis]
MLAIKPVCWLPALTLLTSYLPPTLALPLNMTDSDPSTSPPSPPSFPAHQTYPLVEPLNIAVLLFPAFQALDVFGPLDALNILSQTIPLNLHILASTLSPVSTKPLTLTTRSNFSESVVPTHTFDSPPSDIDVLLVPGGLGTRSPDIGPLVDFIATTYPKVQYMITVCTGSWLAARAGVLDGRRATSNKRSWAGRLEYGSDNVKWVAKARWVVDGNVWTSSGVSAGIDATLDWIKFVWGEERARMVADGMEYDWHTDASWDPFAELYGLKDE